MFGYILDPIAAVLAGESISHYIFVPDSLNIFAIIIISICFLEMIHILYLLTDIGARSLILRPTSLQTVTMLPQTFLVIEAVGLNFILGFGGRCTSYIGKYITLALSILLYVAGILNAYTYGGFISPIHSASIVGINFVCAIICIVNIILLASDVKYSVLAVFVFALAFLLSSYLVI